MIFTLKAPFVRLIKLPKRLLKMTLLLYRVKMRLTMSNAIKLTRNIQIVMRRDKSYREGTYMGEMRFPAMMGRG